jgi:starch synthase
MTSRELPLKSTILHVASECSPFARTGNLADVVSQLPRAQAALGADVTVVLPRYRQVAEHKHAIARRLGALAVPLGGKIEKVTIHEGTLPGGKVRALLLEHPLYDREGLYGDASGDYPDNALRFALLCRAALAAVAELDLWPDIVHGHDWQAGLLPLTAMRTPAPAGKRVPRTVFTVHNLAHRGLFPKKTVGDIGLPWDVFHPEGVEFYDQLCFLKAGIAYAEAVTTVSPRYAREIQGPEQGHGLEGFLRSRVGKISGILNGIDTDEWDPARDPRIATPYAAEDPRGKAANKAALQRELGLPVRAGVPVVATISRLTEAKGLELIATASEQLAGTDAQFVFLGTGEARYETALRELARRYPSRVAVRLAHDEAMAHRIYAGADLFLMPSRVEPCGLAQMYAMRYGTPPVVRATGGLDDTVVDYDEGTRTGSGFKFDEFDAGMLTRTLKRALACYRHKDAWNDLVRRIMRLNFSWSVSARRYLDLYLTVSARSNQRAA